ncbi:DUF3784 domain-containing protein [Bacteroidota bacterium]
MGKDILIFVIVGFVLILSGLIIYKGKAYNLIAGYEILKWKGVDMDGYARIFLIGSLFMGICIMLIPTTLIYFGYDRYAGIFLPVILAIGILYISIVGFRKSKRISDQECEKQHPTRQ